MAQSVEMENIGSLKRCGEGAWRGIVRMANVRDNVVANNSRTVADGSVNVITAENPPASCVFTASISKLNTNSMKITVIVNHFP